MYRISMLVAAVALLAHACGEPCGSGSGGSGAGCDRSTPCEDGSHTCPQIPAAPCVTTDECCASSWDAGAGCLQACVPFADGACFSCVYVAAIGFPCVSDDECDLRCCRQGVCTAGPANGCP
jgi:hypothetical protein